MYASLKNCCSCIRQRWVFAFMCFFGCFHAYTIRSCLPISLTEMVVPIKSDDTRDNTCKFSVSDNVTMNYTTNSLRRLYAWDEQTQGLILSSYYWTYVIAQVPGGIAAEKYGGKHTLGLGILLSAVFTLLSPLSISWGGSTGLIIARLFVGLAHAMVQPAINVLLSQWAPPSERSRMSGLVYSAVPLGVGFANTASGLLIHHTGHISTVFYIFGAIGVVWYLFWLILCYDSPSEHPFISAAELRYLKERQSENIKDKLASKPWRHILRSKAVWALVSGAVGFGWMSMTISTDLPKYASSVLKIPVRDNGYMASLMCASMSIGCFIASWLADCAIEGSYLSVMNVRKIGSVLALSCSACFIVAASYAGCDHLLVTIMFMVATGLAGASFPSIMINPLDISPNYSGTVTALINGLATVSGILALHLVGIMTPRQTLEEWRVVFWLIFAISVLTNAHFLMFGKGQAEWWDNPALEVLQDKKEESINEIPSDKCLAKPS